ncbi:hypothetical protein BGP_5937 [Beggiatoa sp. PS]|nr:hypothetical protein BGP_5937 [Beggiatoa sp. PS]
MSIIVFLGRLKPSPLGDSSININPGQVPTYTPNVQYFGFSTCQVFKTWQVERRFSLFSSSENLNVWSITIIFF